MAKVRRLRKWNSVKGGRRWGRTSGKNRAKNWHETLIEYRKKLMRLLSS